MCVPEDILFSVESEPQHRTDLPELAHGVHTPAEAEQMIRRPELIVELDVQPTVDGVWVVRHGGMTESLGWQPSVAEGLEWKQLQSLEPQVVALADMLDALGQGDNAWYFDLKGAALSRERLFGLLTVVRQAEKPNRPTLFSSQHLLVHQRLHREREAFPELNLGQVGTLTVHEAFGSLMRCRLPVPWVAARVEAGCTHIELPTSLADPANINLIQRRGMRWAVAESGSYWLPRTQHQRQAWQAAGAQWISVDNWRKR